jgi:hypothetical protein
VPPQSTATSTEELDGSITAELDTVAEELSGAILELDAATIELDGATLDMEDAPTNAMFGVGAFAVPFPRKKPK